MPPSVVVTTAPVGVAPPNPPPTATQLETEAHETADRLPMPAGSVCVVQVVPLSVVPTMTAVPFDNVPTASHTEAVGQETPESPLTPVGAAWAAHVAPPSVVA